MLSARTSPARVRPWAVALMTSVALASGCGEGSSAGRSDDTFSTVSETPPSSLPTAETAPGSPTGTVSETADGTAPQTRTRPSTPGPTVAPDERTTQAQGSSTAPRTTAGGSGGPTTQAQPAPPPAPPAPPPAPPFTPPT